MKTLSLILPALLMMEICCLAATDCSNDKGACTLFASGGYDCECLDGGGSAIDADGDSSESQEAASEPSDEACMAILATECPNPAPDPERDCGADAKVLCEDLYDSLNECDEDAEAPDDLAITKCCGDYDEYGDQMRWLLDCLDNQACNEREGVCYELAVVGCDGDGCPDGPIMPGLRAMYKDETLVGEIPADEQSATDADEAEGCSQNANSGFGIGLLLLGLGLTARRRLIRT